MLQRKQTLFLLCVMILSFVGVLWPLATIEPEGMGVGDMVYNICIRKGDGGMSLSVLPLFILDVLVFIISLLTIFLYKNRLLQAKLCISCILLLVVWYAYLIYCWTSIFSVSGTFHVGFSSLLPLINIILCWMARHGIMSDAKLVRSMDRIR